MNENTNTPQTHPPLEIEVKIQALRTDGNRLADVSVCLNGCFAIKGVRIVNGSNGPFVSMPSYKSGNQYRDICFPCTKEFKQEFDRVVLDAYRQQLTQVPQQRQEAPVAPAQSGPTMSM